MKQEISVKAYTASAVLVRQYSTFLTAHFEVASLDRLHESPILGNIDSLTKGTDQSTLVHSVLYKEFDKGILSPLVTSYRALCLEWASELVELYDVRSWALQRFPSVRVQFPANVSVFEFHRDSDYNHPLGEINHFISLTDSIGTAALQIEEDLGWDNYKPLELNAGESAIINTSIFKHGDYVNSEGYTRISLDFRAIPQALLQTREGRKSLTKQMALDCSDYFISSAQLDAESNVAT